MTPRKKMVSLIFALIVPYFAVVAVLVLRDPGHPFPSWFALAAGCYLFISVFVVSMAGLRLSRGQSGPKTEQSQLMARRMRSRGLSLIVVWSAFLLYGAYRTWQGDFPLERAIPAGVLLVLFIGLFSWLLYRDKRRRGS
jgi:hypothetical protein